MKYVFAPVEQPSLLVANSQARFPIRRVFCVGRNYAEHAREMGHDPNREPPFFFTKPADAVVDISAKWPYPPLTQNLHYEIELVVLIGKGGVNIAVNEAENYIFGYAVGIDMTRRDLQGEAKKLGRPWDWGKAFDNSAPCGPVFRMSETGVLSKAAIWLNVNGEPKQRSDISQMIWSVPEVISSVSSSVELKAGDVIMTGTPAGVGPLVRGDHIQAGIDGLGEIETTII